MNIRKSFFKYVSQNILGMIGISVYILADTFFIAQAVGAKGITALNLVLPIYSLIFALGAMIGVGSAIKHTIAKSRSSKDIFPYFTNALFFSSLLGAIFMFFGLSMPEKVLTIMGADEEIVHIGTSYTRIFMAFAPCFMWNHICNAFVRNDDSPSIAMAATLLGSLFNIVMDYVLMFPLGMGMAGAALATALSPIIGIIICCFHLFSRKCHIPLKWVKPSFAQLIAACQVGVSAFVGEISSGVTTIVFNMLLLKLAGNIGVAAYGVVANTSLVAVSIFNGISLGAQPLISTCYGNNDWHNTRHVLFMELTAALILSSLIWAGVFIFAVPITDVFNSEGLPQLTQYAKTGLRIYFSGFLFAGINIVSTGTLGAVEAAKGAFITSISRGFIAISFFAFVLASAFGITGVWLAFPAAELFTLILAVTALKRAFHPTKALTSD